MTLKTDYQHIVLDENQIAYLANTNTKVVELILDHIAYGWSAAEIQRQHPYLTMGQIYSALAYYWDHQVEIEAEIEERLKTVESIRLETQPTALAKRLKQSGLLD